MTFYNDSKESKMSSKKSCIKKTTAIQDVTNEGHPVQKSFYSNICKRKEFQMIFSWKVLTHHAAIDRQRALDELELDQIHTRNLLRLRRWRTGWITNTGIGTGVLRWVGRAIGWSTVKSLAHHPEIVSLRTPFLRTGNKKTKSPKIMNHIIKEILYIQPHCKIDFTANEANYALIARNFQVKFLFPFTEDTNHWLDFQFWMSWVTIWDILSETNKYHTTYNVTQSKFTDYYFITHYLWNWKVMKKWPNELMWFL